MRAIISCAGTGGHIIPAIAIANEIKLREPESEILFIGTKTGMENDLVKKAGFEIEQIDTQSLKRKISLKNVQMLFKNISGFFQSIKLINKFKPEIVIGTGGYVCGPVFMAAFIKKIPTALHESNAFPGKTIKILTDRASVTMVGYEETITRLYGAKNPVYTGSPTNMKQIEYNDNKIREIKRKNNIDENKKVVFAFGGSLGAESITNTFIEMIKQCMIKDYTLVLVTGNKQYEKVLTKINNENIIIPENVKILNFIYNMQEMYYIADLVIARCGALTLTEISTMGKASILIPYPYAAEDHQLYNARVMEQANASKVILDKELNAYILDNSISNIIEDEEKILSMGRLAKKLCKSDSIELIYSEIRKCIDDKK